MIHSRAVTEINNILAANLRHFMDKRGLTQAALGKKAKIGQTTISLYLNPLGRQEGTTGRPPSPTLAKVDSLATALEIELWELLRPMTDAQRALYRSIEVTYKDALAKAKAAEEAMIRQQADDQATYNASLAAKARDGKKAAAKSASKRPIRSRPQVRGR